MWILILIQLFISMRFQIQLFINADPELNQLKSMRIWWTSFRYFHSSISYWCASLKVHKHEIFFNTFFAETETIWSQGPVTRDFSKSIRIGRDIRLLNISAHAQHAMKWFLVCSACDEIRSAYAQCTIKFVPRMLSIDCTCKTVHTAGWASAEIRSSYAQCAMKSVPSILSMR